MDSQLIGASKPPLNKSNKKPSAAEDRQQLVSRYSVMKSNRFQLNTVFGNTNDKLVNNKNVKKFNMQEEKASKRMQRNYQKLKSKTSFEINNPKNNNDQTQMEYSDFMKRAGMNSYNYFKHTQSADIDRKNCVRDIDGASPYNKQLSSKKPITTNYNKEETFQNYKTTFTQKRLKGLHPDTKRFMRIEDIDGAAPIDHHSITTSKRIQMTAPNVDLICQIDNLIQKRQNKNGLIDIFCRKKSDESSAKYQYFNIFEDSQQQTDDVQNQSPFKSKHISEITLDNIGLHRAKQFKSQPRNLMVDSKTTANKSISIANPNRQVIDFSKKSSQRKDRLNQFYSRNTDYNSLAANNSYN